MHDPYSISVGIHQPNFLPWIGFFIKMKQSDHFIFHDAAEYSKNSITRRTYIRKGPEDLSRRYLTVPLQKQSDFLPISDLIIVDNSRWIKKNLSIINNNYGKSPFYEELKDIIEGFLTMADEYRNFSDYSIAGIKTIATFLDISCEYHRSSLMNVGGARSRLNINLVKDVGGTVYNSGQGGKKYQKEKDFLNAGIQLNYLDISNYLNQLNINKATMGYSILELLFCEGIESTKRIIHNYESYQAV